MSPATMPITWYADAGDTEVTRNVPFKWAICPVCDGHATDRGASVECDGGGFTSSEWAEQDDDFKQDYLSGAYDRPCTACEGLGRIQQPDLDALDADERTAYERSLRDDRDFRAILPPNVGWARDGWLLHPDAPQARHPLHAELGFRRRDAEPHRMGD